MEKIWYTYGYLKYQFKLADEMILALTECLEIVEAETNGKTSEDGTDLTYQYTVAAAQLQAAKDHLEAEKQKQNEKYAPLISNWKTQIKANPISVENKAEWEQTIEDLFAGKTELEAAFDALNGFVCDGIDAYNQANANTEGFTPVEHDLDQIKADSGFEEPEEETDQEETSDEVEFNRYHVTNNNVVAVTYGDIVEGQKVAQKTFLLNYNNYAVRVTYNKIVYTIEAGGYVIVPTAKA